MLSNLSDIELQLIRNYDKASESFSSLFDSLKWINKAWSSPDDEDKIIYSIIALEFSVAHEKGEPLVDKLNRNLIKNDLRTSIEAHCAGNLELSQQLLEKFDASCTEPPFMLKLRNMIERLGIPISESDFSLLVRARKKRNDIIHGKAGSKLTIHEVRLLCEIISTIVFYRLRQEVSSV